MKSGIILTVVLLSSYCVVICKTYDYDSSADVDSDEKPENIPDMETALDLSGNVRKLFVLELGLSAKKQQNVICSPLAAVMPLAKLLLGAQRRSKTEKELLAGSGLSHSTELKSVFKDKIKLLENLKGVEVSLASKLYLSDHKRILSQFKRKSQNIFRSDIELIDTSRPEEVANQINDWVSESTQNKIRKVISKNDINGGTSFILVNCVYFKGQWATPFRESRLGSFYTPSGAKQVAMMTRSGYFKHLNSMELNAQILELPYDGYESAMLIVLPNSRRGLISLLRKLKSYPELLNEALNNMKSKLVAVTIPKFKIESKVDLKTWYRKMGIKNILHPSTSQLNGIVRDEVEYISNAIHKAVIEVDERGTEAAAASVLSVLGISGQEPMVFMADHSFLFYVRAQQEQLFAGVVNNP